MHAAARAKERERVRAQAASEYRQGLVKATCFFLFAVNLLCMFMLGLDVWAIHRSQEVVRTQLLENKWDEARAHARARARVHAGIAVIDGYGLRSHGLYR